MFAWFLFIIILNVFFAANLGLLVLFAPVLIVGGLMFVACLFAGGP